MDVQAEEQLNRLISAYNNKMESEDDDEYEMMKMSSMEIDQFEQKLKHKDGEKTNKKEAKKPIEKSVTVCKKLEPCLPPSKPKMKDNPSQVICPKPMMKIPHIAGQIDDLEFDEEEYASFHAELQNFQKKVETVSTLKNIPQPEPSKNHIVENPSVTSVPDKMIISEQTLKLAQQNEKIDILVKKIGNLEKEVADYKKILKKEFGNFSSIPELESLQKLNTDRNTTKDLPSTKNIGSKVIEGSHTEKLKLKNEIDVLVTSSENRA